MKRFLSLLLCLILFTGSAMAVNVTLEQDPDPGLIDLLKVIRPLTTLSSYMNTAAHPDDENSALLAALALGKGTSTNLVTITRGQGGQNAIGPEHYDAMGVLRTEELGHSMEVLATSVDYVRENVDSPARDFGFSKMWEETEEKWDFDFVIERMTYYLRLYRPQVVLLPFNFVRTQHGHHQAIYICALKAMEAAADPEKYLEHNLPPFTPYKVYEPGNADNAQAYHETGTFDPFYGKTYDQIGQYARLFHACQGMGGRPLPIGRTNYLMAVAEAKPRLEVATTLEGIFDRIPTTYTDYAALSQGALKDALLKLDTISGELDQAFPYPEQLLPVLVSYKQALLEVSPMIGDSGLNEDLKNDLEVQLRLKIVQVDRALAQAAGLQAVVLPSDMTVTPGQTFTVDVRLFQGLPGEYAWNDVALSFPNQEQWTITPVDGEGELGLGKALVKRFEVTAPATEDFFDAYHGDKMTAVLKLNGPIDFEITANTQGNFAYLPELSLLLNPEKTAVNLLKEAVPSQIKVTLTNLSTQEVTAKAVLELPEGWSGEPANQDITLAPDASAEAIYQVSVPEGLQPGNYTIKATATTTLGISSRTVQTIDYPHINKTYFLYNAQVELNAFNLAFSDTRIGYVDSGSDEVAQTLKTLGMNVNFITDDELLFGDLSRYDTIITGIRAYARRPVVKTANQRLLDFAKAGGHLIIQYHTSGDGYTPDLAPLPLKVGQPSLAWRVTYEDSPVTILLPDHPFLTSPNEITIADFDGWVQERSLYIPMEWDATYEAPIRSGTVAQEGAEYDGQILTMPYGEGRFTYTALVFFRQVPNLVPGGIRLFTNIIDAK